MQSTPRISLTDLPVTYEQYQDFRDNCTNPSNAFIVAIGENIRAKTTTKMLEVDNFPLLTQCIPTVIGMDIRGNGVRGYNFPFSEEHPLPDNDLAPSADVPTYWTIEATQQILQFARELAADAANSAKALECPGEFYTGLEWRAKQAAPMAPPPKLPNLNIMLYEEGPLPLFETELAPVTSNSNRRPSSEAMALIASIEPHVEVALIRSVCIQAAAVAGAFVKSLENVVMAKKAWADFIISIEMDVPFDGVVYNLCHNDGLYLYISKDGNSCIPF